MIDLLLMPILAGLGLSIVCGPLGCFVVWRRMAYFGETIAHASLVGAAIGIALNIHTALSVTAIAMLVASLFGMATVQNRDTSSDTILGIISHGSLAIGLIMISMMAGQRINLIAILTGDILSVTALDLGIIFSVVALTAIALAFLWRKLILLVIDEDLASVEGHDIKKLRMILATLIAIIVAISVKIVGVLLITALLIIPAATSRKVCRSPEAMAVVATIISTLSILLGFVLSYYLDIPTGPGVVVCSLCFFLIAQALRHQS